MSDSQVSRPSPGQPVSPPKRRVVRSGVRSVASTVVLVTIYYVLPLDRTTTTAAVGILIIGLAGLIAMIVWQTRAIIRSPYPAMRGVEALSVTVPLFLILFAATYVVMATVTPGAFTQPLSRTDSLYFTVTVFTTVGFGDIVAKSEPGRLVVTVQMIADLVIIGIGIRVILGAVRRGQQRRSPPAPDAGAAASHETPPNAPD